MTELRLRDYQQATVDLLRGGFAAGHTRQIVVLPTGAGKTETAAAIATMAKSRGNKLWFIVDRITLAWQTKERFEKYGMTCGILQGENSERSADDDAVVSTIQTLNARFEKNPTMLDADILVFDEIHNFHQAHKDILAYRTVPCIGLTATPHNAELGLHFSNVISPVTTQKLIDLGHLVPPRVFAPSTPDLAKVRFQRGDFVESDLEDAMTVITADVVDNWLRKGEDRPTIAFCVNVKHAKEMAQQFVDAGIHADVVHGGTPVEDRAELYQKLASGDIKVLTSVYVLGTGFDLPEVSCAILARPTASEALHIQQCGRTLRTADDKVDALIFDHAGNTERHGQPQHYEPPALDEVEKRTRKERNPKEKRAITCSNCGSMMEPGQQICGACGIRREHVSDVITVDGRLVEVDEDDTENADSPIARRRFFKELKGYAAQKGFKQGWAVHKYQERYGCLPWQDGSIKRYNSITADPPSADTIRWISNRNKYNAIRKAKGRASYPTSNVKMEDAY